jgi:hypothetical protein
VAKVAKVGGGTHPAERSSEVRNIDAARVTKAASPVAATRTISGALVEKSTAMNESATTM